MQLGMTYLGFHGVPDLSCHVADLASYDLYLLVIFGVGNVCNAEIVHGI